MDYEKQFKTDLKLARERVTAPRVGIFRILLRQAPLSMNLLIAKAGTDGIDSVTAYRTVNLLRKLGLVQEVGAGRKRLLELSDHYYTHHHHATCVSCGRIIDFDSTVIEDELKRLGGELKFDIHSHQLEATGSCERCTNFQRLQSRARQYRQLKVT